MQHSKKKEKETKNKADNYGEKVKTEKSFDELLKLAAQTPKGKLKDKK